MSPWARLPKVFRNTADFLTTDFADGADDENLDGSPNFALFLFHVRPGATQAVIAS